MHTPTGDKAFAVDALLRTRGTDLRTFLLEQAHRATPWTAAADALNVELATVADDFDMHPGDALRVSRESVRRWTAHYLDAPAEAAA